MAKERKKTKVKGRVSRLLIRLAAVTASVYLVAAFVNGQVQVSRKANELAELEAKVQQQTEDNKELQALLEAGNEDAYVERVAREKLGYARPNERIYVDIAGE